MLPFLFMSALCAFIRLCQLYVSPVCIDCKLYVCRSVIHPCLVFIIVRGFLLFYLLLSNFILNNDCIVLLSSCAPLRALVKATSSRSGSTARLLLGFQRHISSRRQDALIILLGYGSHFRISARSLLPYYSQQRSLRLNTNYWTVMSE